MLILSRKKGQKLIINDNIEVIVIDSDNGVVKLGIDAPKDITVFREEVYIELKKANKDSTSAALDSINNLQKHIEEHKVDNKLKSISVKISKDETK